MVFRHFQDCTWNERREEDPTDNGIVLYRGGLYCLGCPSCYNLKIIDDPKEIYHLEASEGF